MLVLSRKAGEQLLIGDSIVITVVRISSHDVRIGIKAPADVDVVRTELIGATASAKIQPSAYQAGAPRRTAVTS